MRLQWQHLTDIRFSQYARLLLSWLISTDLRFVNGSNIKLQLSDGRPSMVIGVEMEREMGALHCHGHISLSARCGDEKSWWNWFAALYFLFAIIVTDSSPSVRLSRRELHNFPAFQLFCILHFAVAICLLGVFPLRRFHRYSAVKLPSGKRRHFPSLFHPTSRCHPQQKEIKTKNCTLSWLFNTKLNLICFSVVQSLSFFVSFAFIWHVCCLIEREIAVDWLFCMQCVICYRYCYCHFNCCLYFPLGYG